MELDYTFSSLLAGYRRRSQLTQAQLADRAGCARNTIGNWERGERLPRTGDREILDRVIQALELSADERAALLQAAAGGRAVPIPGNSPLPVLLPDIRGAVGREEEIARVERHLAEAGVAGLVGMPGAGKRTLAALVAQRRAAAGRAVFWHRCSPVEGYNRLIRRLADQLVAHGRGAPRERLRAGDEGRGQRLSLAEITDELLDALAGVDLLIWLDSFHHIAGEPLAHEFVQQLLLARTARRAELLLTSRRMLTGPLRLHVQRINGLSEADTRLLLSSYGLQGIPENLFAQLYRKTGGNPMVLALVRERLLRSRDLGSTIGKLARVGILQEELHQLHATLSEHEQAVMGAVAVLLDTGGTREAIERIMGATGAGRELNDLCAQLWLDRDDEDEPLYRQHEVIREFCYELLDPPLRAVAHRRAAGYYLDAHPPDHFRAVLHLLYGDDHGRAAELATADLWKIVSGGRIEALYRLLDERLDESRLSAELQIGVCFARGELATLLGKGEAARAAYHKAIALIGQQPQTAEFLVAEARACRGLAEAWEYERPREALSWVDRGLALLEGSDAPERAYLLIRRGSILTKGSSESGESDFAAAQAALHAALALLPPEDSFSRARALGTLGRLAALAEQYEAARAAFTEALALFQQLKNSWGELGASENIARIDEIVYERWEQAASEYERLLALSHDLGSVNRQITLELALGILRTNQGRYDTARLHLERCEALVREYRQHEYLTATLSSLADLHLRRGDLGAAKVALEQASEVAARDPAGELDQLPEIYRGWALLYLDTEQQGPAHAAARASLRYARRLRQRTGRQDEEGKSMRLLGQVLAAKGRPRAAARAFAVSLGLLERHGSYEAARTRVAWGRMLIASASPDDGLGLLRTAAERFRELGAARDLAAIEGLL